MDIHNWEGTLLLAEPLKQGNQSLAHSIDFEALKQTACLVEIYSITEMFDVSALYLLRWI